MFAMFTQMTCKFQLTVLCKNGFRKKRTAKRGYAVKIAQSFPICILLDLASVLKVSISRRVMDGTSVKMLDVNFWQSQCFPQASMCYCW